MPFGAEASPFIQHHLNHQVVYESMVNAFRENTYVDNVMKAGDDPTELEK